MSKIMLFSVFLLANLVIAFGLHLPSTPVGTLATADEAMSVRGAECWVPMIPGTRWVCGWGHWVGWAGIDTADNFTTQGGVLALNLELPCTCAGSYMTVSQKYCWEH